MDRSERSGDCPGMVKGFVFPSTPSRLVLFQTGLTQRRKAAKEEGGRYCPGRKADHDPCQLVWQVNESGSESGVLRERLLHLPGEPAGVECGLSGSHLANKTTSPAGQARRGRPSRFYSVVLSIGTQCALRAFAPLRAIHKRHRNRKHQFPRFHYPGTVPFGRKGTGTFVGLGA